MRGTNKNGIKYEIIHLSQSQSQVIKLILYILNLNIQKIYFRGNEIEGPITDEFESLKDKFKFDTIIIEY